MPREPGEALQEFENGEFQNPKPATGLICNLYKAVYRDVLVANSKGSGDSRQSKEHPANEHQATGYLLLVDLLWRELNPREVGVVGSVQQNIVNAAHAQKQRYQHICCNSVFPEQPFIADEPTSDS